MTETLSVKIGKADFNPDKYVKELSQRCVGGQELQQQRNKIQALSEETNALLKKNVYQNYMQFIETAKEISHLESEMYQLSHMLTEQRDLLGVLAQTSILGTRNNPNNEPNKVDSQDELEKLEEERIRKLTNIMERVENCPGLLDRPNRTFVYEGDLQEIEPVEGNPIAPMHAYLFSDQLLLASAIPNRRGPVRYKYQTTYELGSLAVVNVRDISAIKNCFKLLTFPDTRAFKCSTLQLKQEWLDRMDKAKRQRVTKDGSSTATASLASNSAAPSNDTTPSIDRTVSLESTHSLLPEVEELPEWLLELPEDIDVAVAQRCFEEAYDLLQRGKNYLTSHANETHAEPELADISRKLEARTRTLTQVLLKELEVSPDKSLQGGLRAARRAVRLLNLLHHSTQACQLFLQLCTHIVKAQVKHVKREGATVVYVRHLSGKFFATLGQVLSELLRAFPGSASCSGAFSVWAGDELAQFAQHLVKHVFLPKTSVSTLAECVHHVRHHCDQLCELGVDLSYQLDGQLREPLSRALLDARDKMVDAVKIRAYDDKWSHYNLHTKAGLSQVLQELADFGLNSVQNFTTGESWLALTANTVLFAKLWLGLVEDSVRLATPELLCTVDQLISDVLAAHLKHVENALSDSQLLSKKAFILKNASFLVDCVLTSGERVYESRIGYPCLPLSKMKKEYSAKFLAARPQAAARSEAITKYSSTEYI